MKTNNRTKITVQTMVGQPTDKVWNLWTLPEHITKWNYASNEWQCPWAENDLRPGGTFVSRMESRDGNTGFDFEGIYEKVMPNRLITYTMSDGRRVKVMFHEQRGNTTITEVFEAEGTHSMEEQRDGWQAILNNFKKYAETSI